MVTGTNSRTASANWSTGDDELTMGVALLAAQNVALFFLETNLDYLSQVAAGYWPGHIPRSLSFKEPRTIAHEIGHQFGISPHTPGTLIGPWDGSDYDLNASQIAQIRNSDKLGDD